MSKIRIALVVLLLWSIMLPAIAFAQTQKAAWQNAPELERKSRHSSNR